MPRKSPFVIDLSDDEQKALGRMVRRYTSPYCEVIRAKIVLLAAQGWENQQIARHLDLPRQIVCRWRKRFFEQRLAGLHDLPRSGRPWSFPPSGRHADQSSGL